MRSKFKWIFTLLVALTMQFSFAQQKTVTGTVLSDGAALPGASVMIKGTQQGTTTDANGKYSIKAKEGDELEVTFVGKPSQSAKVGASNVVNFTLAGDIKIADVIVTTSLGIKKRKDAVTSTSQEVKAKELNQANNPNAVQALAGKVSGLQINLSENGVQGSSKIVLRGNRSVTGNNSALIVIDNGISTMDVFTQLPPEVIENVNVIKGAQGAALYGSDGANGVIIVTTKKGTKKGKMTVDINSAVDFESIAFLPRRQTKYGQGWNDGGFYNDYSAIGVPVGNGFISYENGAWGPEFADPTMPSQVPVGLPQGNGDYIYSDWKSRGYDNIKDFFQTGATYQNGITVNAGGEDGYAVLNIKRDVREFVVKDDELKRTSFTFKAGKKINKFSIDGGMNYINQSISKSNDDLYDDLLQTSTHVPVDKFRNARHTQHWTIYAFNPWRLAEANRENSKTNTMIGNLTLSYELNKNLSIVNNANFRYVNLDRDTHNDGVNLEDEVIDLGLFPHDGQSGWSSIDTYSGLGGQGEAASFYATQSITKYFYNDLMLNLDYDLVNNLNLKSNIGFNVQDRYFRTIQQGGTGLKYSNFYHITNVINPDVPSTLDNRLIKERKVSPFYNIDLGYKEFLFLNTTGRWEQASVLNGQTFFYYSGGLSFVPTKLAFLNDNKVLNYAKVYASYVKNGIANAEPYATNVNAANGQGFPFDNLSGFVFPRTLTNNKLQPEFVTTKEAGIDLGFFKDRITLSAAYYLANTDNLITGVSSSSASGILRMTDNIGTLENKGFEVDLGLVPFRSERGFNWSMKFGYTAFKTKITSLTEDAKSIALQQNTFIGAFAEVGEEFPLIKGTAYVRDANGSIIVDANGFPLRTSTFEKLGKATPDYIVNFSNTFAYRGVSLTAVMDYRTGHSVYAPTTGTLAFAGYLEDSADFDRNVGYVVPNSVVEDGANPGTYVTNTNPVGNGGYAGTLNYFSGRYNRTGEQLLLDASALKIRELALGYSLPKKLLTGTKIEGVKFSVYARNPFVFLADGKLLKAKNGMENKGYIDPEASNVDGNNRTAARNAAGFADTGQYPTTRTIGVSLNLTF